jgi:steroid 5-alpha reductase family enzyme
VAILFYAFAIYLIKLSFLFLYMNIFSHSPRTRIVLYLVLSLIVFATIWNLAVICTACIPLDAFWDPLKAPGAYCHGVALYWANTGLHVATDYVLFVVPLPNIWSMRLPRRQKGLILGLFSMGFM